MGHRRKAREYALQGLYMYELSKTPVEELLKLGWTESASPDNIHDFAVELISGSISHIDEIDEIIIKHSKNWKFERLSVVDKSILRLSIYAMLYLRDIPVIVTINEGIELGKIFGGESSGQFINGILDAVRKHELDEKERNSQ
ncbi:MAG TPA: transcription antitermination factor NusB [Spirochaetota bacterium]|nr:transcription antitermination factor NusB [Spirochaetota bacterium]HOD16780.1 transcription antitermination factor NusB [Spirochaetota bacterium]HPG52079.1 transcription antitermination factor NusB [Spirochaetota bacterium]HQL80758.1 transcription antitermination factor NusB [Spirochaetota bacterium]